MKKFTFIGSTFKITIPEIKVPKELKALADVKLPYVTIRIKK